MQKVGLWLAMVALLVNGPRYVIVFLQADDITIPLTIEGIMLGLTGIATGLVLTGGGAYIAHTLAESQTRGIVRTVIVTCWFSLLIFNVILLAPLMVSAIRDSSLKDVLETSFSQWLWSITSVLAVEIISAGAMAAYALEGKLENASHTESQPSTFSILTSALVRRLENSIAPQPAVSTIASHQPANNVVTAHTEFSTVAYIPDSPPQDEKFVEVPVNDRAEETGTEQEKRSAKSERQEQLLELLRDIAKESDIQIDKLAEKFQVSQQTIYRDIADLKSRKLLVIEDSVVKVIV